MATAIVQSTVTKVVLNLTIEEAVLLESLTGHINGPAIGGTPRAVMSGIGIALRQAGVLSHSPGRRQVKIAGASSFGLEWR